MEHSWLHQNALAVEAQYPLYKSCVDHCDKSQCTMKDSCYRYWLGQQWLSHNVPRPQSSQWFVRPEKINEECEFFLEMPKEKEDKL